MSREVRRVPLDFDWPHNKVWDGYLMPESLKSDPCDACRSTGTTPARQWVDQIARLLLMLDEDLNQQQRDRPMHPYLRDTGTRAWSVRPSGDIAEFGTGLAGRPASFMGHDAVDGWRATEKVIRAAGLDPGTWGKCLSCDGLGYSDKYPGQSVDAEAWECTEPPTGEGWQLWETVSEGSPISPVFAEKTGLVDWLCSDAYRIGISTPMEREQAERFVDAGWAPSMVFSTATGLIPGEQFTGGAS